ncbi:rodlin [Streptomyces sp. NPDC006743]|uniref:rodlin n=1 Tax=unclassified Streptomyces TaxID=2593676 RepID=UPI000564EC68|nr:rodlin [Streptomyces sp. NRRL S-340]BFD84759.1 rodlin RdlA [Streptomyces sp. Xyl84]
MLKKAMVAAAAAVSVVGGSVAAAPAALAIGNDNGPSIANGNDATSSFGNSATKGDMSPQLSLIEGTLNKPCLGLNETNVGVLQIVNVQDIPILSDRQNQQCSDNSTQAKRDGALSHILEDLSVLSANGES